MNTSLLIELFLYYARFPARNAVNPLFNKGKSNIPGYDELQKAVDTLSEEPVLPKVDNYVFGPNFDAVSSRVNNMTGFYLFVDYGEIECATDNSNRFTDSARLAITVAYKLKEFSGDLVEQLIISDHCLSYLSLIRNRMIQEQRERCWLKDVSRSHTLTPFIARELSSIGWTMLFNREGYDTFGAKCK